MFKKLENETFGEYIARLRKGKGYSQRKLALVTGISNTTISRIEKDTTTNPDLATLKLLSTHLDVDEIYMLQAAGYSDQSSNPSETNTDGKDLSKRDLKQIEKDLEKMMDDIKSNPDDGFAAFDGETEMDEEDLELLEDAFRTALKVVKKLNKQTYTPKKYK